jgi:hypothetical protein
MNQQAAEVQVVATFRRGRILAVSGLLFSVSLLMVAGMFWYFVIDKTPHTAMTLMYAAVFIVAAPAVLVKYYRIASNVLRGNVNAIYIVGAKLVYINEAEFIQPLRDLNVYVGTGRARNCIVIASTAAGKVKYASLFSLTQKSSEIIAAVDRAKAALNPLPNALGIGSPAAHA